MNICKSIILPLLSLLLLTACGIGQEGQNDEMSHHIEAKGGRNYGGVFRLNETENIKTLFPPSITDAYSYRVANPIFEGLFTFDQSDISNIKPLLVDHYELSDDRTVYTFHLKQGVFFHDDPCFGGKGRELVAEDVRYCLTQLCTQNLQNKNFAAFKDMILGAKEYYAASANGQKPNQPLEGVNVLNKYTVQVTLQKPNALFMVALARPAAYIYPHEAVEKYGLDVRTHPVGTGPFFLSNIDEDVSVILKKNLHYHRNDQFGNPLPFLDALSMSFIKDKKTELLEFKKGKLDMVYRLPTEYIIEILEEAAQKGMNVPQDYVLQRVPEMISQYLTFRNDQGVFKDINVRKAINFAIDRHRILDFVLNGEGYAPAEHGVTPPVFKNYKINNINGFTLNLDSAQYYLQKAGYNRKNPFPTIKIMLNAEGDRNTFVALEIQKELKDHLNINLELQILPFSQLLEKSFSGDFSLVRTAWLADYPSPENFLWQFYGDHVPDSPNAQSVPNIGRFKDKKYDALFDQAINASSIDEANKYFKKAENYLMTQAPIVPLWYDEGYRLVKTEVENFPNNPMQFRDFSEVYFKPHTDQQISAVQEH
ncbi:ABC transporter substrate-binding protein [Persicobacter psychrovividus]|uniref:Peptide ABC transporter substrate-binding protein n=1 Tax=Persicobacter psychrovividus TaxID=387638 RepID=A0ABN6LBD6_9BACT|nr:peptide ABC transporter substrate-binding protein [Persicobacter psychrovividus]